MSKAPKAQVRSPLAGRYYIAPNVCRDMGAFICEHPTKINGIAHHVAYSGAPDAYGNIDTKWTTVAAVSAEAHRGFIGKIADYVYGAAHAFNPFPDPGPVHFYTSDVEALHSDWSIVGTDLEMIYQCASELLQSFEDTPDEAVRGTSQRQDQTESKPGHRERRNHPAEP